MIITSEVETLSAPKQSPSDRKEYNLIKLPNGLKALLSRHPKIKGTVEDESVMIENSSVVALCIEVGSFWDPVEVQGLSHFLEHMVRS